MQRIDENTYIDDTLVTCAEYQLFIDEMRKQGKYYQPDHWTSYQFPDGQARESILGVRHSDAVAFCEWLIKLESGGWKYCLPTHSEVASFSLKSPGQSCFGYWLNQEFQFAWTCLIPEDARKSTLTGAMDYAINYRSASRSTFEIAINIYRAFVNIKERKRDLARESNHAKILKKALDQTIDFAFTDDSGRTRNRATFPNDLNRIVT